MGRVLDKYPLEIVEVVLEVTVPVQTRRLMGAVLKARFSRFPASLSEAQKVAQTDSPAATDEMRSSRLDRAAAGVRSLLATAENVHTWSHACLEHLIRKSMELRPSTLIKKGTACTTTINNKTGSMEAQIGRIRREEFEKAESCKDYLPQYTGPPSWAEEQRMIKAFWRLQFFLELQDAGNKGRLGTCWPGQEVDVLSKSSPDGFYDVPKPYYNFEREQTLTACDFFGAVTSGSITLVEAVHDNAYRLPTIRWIEGTVPRCFCAEPPSFGFNEDIFYQGPENLDRMPMSYLFHHAMSTTDGWLDGCPLTLVFPFQCWRKYGFAIWDDKRMADLGMRDPRGRSIMKKYISYSFRWFSILTEEDLRDVR
ncbi:hypothetical protein EJ02DRAFT_458231 [Clathrospora elynae]|uniref:Uncharacterized protein n=1 Tax=Clathrospora elynae TaxID=706981 RepID=A0A6A5SL18_9PLEO|nr:hypothetical protein EJ02DRAFT_460638 [Clathrospora elynae]KAF1938037.1 hypothetical protein EJ02DRAFT_458231 [Clathrospora elynae]